jgi:hypothetical protein
MDDFKLDFAVSLEQNIDRFRLYVVKQYAADRRLCRCSRKTCGEVVPERKENRALVRKSYNSKSTIFTHKKGARDESHKGYWLVPEFVDECKAYLQRIYNEGSELGHVPVEEHVGGLHPPYAVQLVEPGEALGGGPPGAVCRIEVVSQRRVVFVYMIRIPKSPLWITS